MFFIQVNKIFIEFTCFGLGILYLDWDQALEFNEMISKYISQ